MPDDPRQQLNAGPFPITLHKALWDGKRLELCVEYSGQKFWHVFKLAETPAAMEAEPACAQDPA